MSGRTTSTSPPRSSPLLLQEGVTQEQIDELLVANPRRFFEPTSERS